MERKNKYIFCDQDSNLLHDLKKDLLKDMRKTKSHAIIITSSDAYSKYFYNPLFFSLDKKETVISKQDQCKNIKFDNQLNIFKINPGSEDYMEQCMYSIITSAWNAAQKHHDYDLFLIVDHAELLMNDIISVLCLRSYLDDAAINHLFFYFISENQNTVLSSGVVDLQKDIVINERR